MPQIYQDSDEVPARKPCVVAAGAASVRQNTRSQLKRQPTRKVDRNEVVSETPVHVQDENQPPLELTSYTPSAQRFKNVLDISPSTPKHRVRAQGGLLTPETPRVHNVSPLRAESVYTRARQLFAPSASPTKLIGRDSERSQLQRITLEAKTQQHGSCTYISGPPGTGKSALVHQVLESLREDPSYSVSIVNCLGLTSAGQVYDKLVQDLLPTSNSKATPEARLKRLFTTKKPVPVSYVVMLDEIDSLVDNECAILYNIFEWALLPSSSLTLIGIANALDLTDRFLPKLKSRGLKPQLLPFLPYTAQQISSIITERLRSLLPETRTSSADFVPCVHPAAIQLCGKKIASQTGDLRKAFSLVRRAIDQVEKESQSARVQQSPTKNALSEIVNNPVRSVVSEKKIGVEADIAFTAETAPRATISHMARLAASIFNNSAVTRLNALNLQQKAVLCSIINKESRRQNRDPYRTPTKTANKAPTVGELYAQYTFLCKRDDGVLQPLKDTEFRDVVASLETLGLVHESKARSASFLTPSSSSKHGRMTNEQAIASVVTGKEMRESLKGPGADLLNRLLDEA